MRKENDALRARLGQREDANRKLEVELAEERSSRRRADEAAQGQLAAAGLVNTLMAKLESEKREADVGLEVERRLHGATRTRVAALEEDVTRLRTAMDRAKDAHAGDVRALEGAMKAFKRKLWIAVAGVVLIAVFATGISVAPALSVLLHGAAATPGG